RGGRSAVTAAGDGDPASNSGELVATPVPVPGSPDRRRPSGKAARYVERLALLQDVIAGARQLVRQRLGGDHVVGLGPSSWLSCGRGSGWLRRNGGGRNSPLRRR